MGTNQVQVIRSLDHCSPFWTFWLADTALAVDAGLEHSSAGGFSMPDDDWPEYED